MPTLGEAGDVVAARDPGGGGAVGELQGTAPAVVDFIEGYSPKHYSAFEFPVIAERSTQTLHYYTGTPIWGAAYYKGFRAEAEQLVGF